MHSTAGPASWDWVQLHGGWTRRSADRRGTGLHMHACMPRLVPLPVAAAAAALWGRLAAAQGPSSCSTAPRSKNLGDGLWLPWFPSIWPQRLADPRRFPLPPLH